MSTTKTAFSTSAYSGPLNPVIASGASFQPPRRAPQLKSAIQKTASWPSFFDEMQKLAAELNLGQWWDQVGGPHLAQGGGRRELGKMMTEAALPPKVQAKFMSAAQTRYKAPYLHTRTTEHLLNAARIGIPLAAVGGVMLYDHLKNKKKPETQKEAAGAPTRGNFMMASDIPPFKAPRLDRAIQKQSEYGGMFRTQKDDEEQDKRDRARKEKGADMLPDYVTYGPGDFKKSKYAMPTEEMSTFVADLLKAGAVKSPASQLAQSQSVGAPKASAPPGPSIADIAKPKGARFGTGIAGAFKTTIGGTGPTALK